MSRDLRSGSSLEDLDPPFTEEEARQVLARAAEYERAMTAGVPAAHLRAAALEAGLSSAAFDSAVAAVREARGATSARGRSRRRTVAAVLGFALVLGAGTTARWRGAAPSGLGTPAPGASPGDAAPPARGAPGPERAAAPTCGTTAGIPAERRRTLAGQLYPDALVASNRHRSFVVGLLFDAECNLKAHVLTRRRVGETTVDAVLGPAFPVAGREHAFQRAGIADLGPWTFEPGAPWIMWAVERAPQ